MTIESVCLVAILSLPFTGCETTNQVATQKPSVYKKAEFDEQFVFPDQFLDLPKVSEIDYEKDTKGLGYSVGYNKPGITATFYVYDLSIPKIADGSRDDTVVQAFIGSANEIRAIAARGDYGVESMADGTEVMIGSQSFLYTKATLLMGQRKSDSYILVTGFKNKILKVRMSYDQIVYGDSEGILDRLMDEIDKSILIPNTSVDRADYAYSLQIGDVMSSDVEGKSAVWLAYLMARQVWIEEHLKTIDPKDIGNYHVRYGEEVAGREAMVDIWKSFKGNKKAGQDRYLEDLVLIADADLLEEYVWVFLNQEYWGAAPPDLELEELLTWMSENLPNHEVETHGAIGLERKE